MSDVTVANLKAVISADTSGAIGPLAQMAGLMASTGPIVLGAALIGAAIVGIGAISLKMAGDFQSSTAQLVTGAGLAANDLGKVRQDLLQMAVDTGTSTSQLVSGLYMISSAGYNTSQSLVILKAAAEGAKVGNADLGTVADATTTIMKDYAGSHVTAAQAVNLLIGTVASGKTHMQDLADSISTVLPTAAKFGVSLGDVMGAMATMTAHGIAAANAATYLRQMIVSLNAPTSAGVKALASVGLTAQDVTDEIRNKGLPAALDMITTAIGKTFPAGSTAALDAFKNIAGGSRQMQGMLALTGSTAKEFATDAAKLGGAVSSSSTQITGWSRIQDTFNQQMSRASEAVQVMMIELGQKLLPVATQVAAAFANNVIPTIQNFVAWVTTASGWVQQHKILLVALGAAIAGILVVAFIAWAAAAAAAAIATIAATWPILAIGAALGLLVAAIIWAYNNWGFFRTAINGVVQDVKDTIIVFQAIWSWLGKVAGAVGNLIGLLGQLKNAVGNALGGVGNALGSIHLPGFASGGTMPDTGLAVVGEKGPELVALPGSTQITPLTGANAIQGPPSNAALLSGAAGGSSQGTINLTVQLDSQVLTRAVLKNAPGQIRLATGARNF